MVRITLRYNTIASRSCGAVYTTPGFCNEKIAIYLATDLSQHPAHPDADEFLGLTKMPLEEAVRRYEEGIGILNGLDRDLNEMKRRITVAQAEPDGEISEIPMEEE